MPVITVTSADGTPLAARCSGDGTPIVLVHGANGDLDTFALVEPALAERHTVWVYSRRGRGGSGDGPDYSTRREVEDVLAVVDAAGGRPHLFGHSGGAVYALWAAAERPSLRSLLLYEPPLNIDRVSPDNVAELDAMVRADQLDETLSAFFPQAGIVDEEVQVLRSIEPVWTRIRAGVRLLPRELRATLDEDVDRMRSFVPPPVPTLFLYGEKTEGPALLTPAEAAEQFPEAVLHSLPGQRHLAFAFDPGAFAEAVLAFTTAHDD